MTIPEIIQKMVKEQIMPVYATVKSVDGTLCDVTSLADETDILDVRLVAENNDGILVTPVVGSVVGVVMINEIEGFVVFYSRINSIKYGDGIFEGMVKVIELTQKLNTIEGDLNDLKTAINSWTPVPSDGGAALKTALATYISNTLTETTKAEIQNNKITHGGF